MTRAGAVARVWARPEAAKARSGAGEAVGRGRGGGSVSGGQETAAVATSVAGRGEQQWGARRGRGCAGAATGDGYVGWQRKQRAAAGARAGRAGATNRRWGDADEAVGHGEGGVGSGRASEASGR
nr:glycine-rich cell wall structural protein 1.0-like [Aegilops tauschii subsp. strangulata]